MKARSMSLILILAFFQGEEIDPRLLYCISRKTKLTIVLLLE